MGNIILGSDIDDCILDTVSLLLEEVNKKLSSSLKYEDIKVHSLAEAFNIDEDIVDSIVLETISRNEIPSMSGSSLVISQLSMILDSPIFFISKRSEDEFFLSKTRLQLINAGIDCEYLLYHTKDKVSVINDNNISIFIEDRLDTIMDIYNNTNCTIFIFDHPWNRNIAENVRIWRIRNWAEIRDLLMIERLNNEV